MHSRGSSGALDRLVPAALRGRGYIVTAIGIALALTLFAVVAWFPYSSSTRTVHRAHVDPGPPVCPADCGVGPDARGQCANATCVCAPGWGNVNCNFSAVQLYGSTDIYKGFPKIEKDEQNWSDDKGVYETIAAEADAVTIIEVGTWKGGSARVWASWLQSRGRGVVICVDTWLGSVEHWLYVRDPVSALKLDHGHPIVYSQFMNNIINWNLTDYVLPFPTASIHAALYFKERGIQADVVYIDAGHDYDSVKQDVEMWWPVVRPGGIISGHDFGHGPVASAVQDVAKAKGGLVAHAIGASWWLRLPRYRTAA